MKRILPFLFCLVLVSACFPSIGRESPSTGGAGPAAEPKPVEKILSTFNPIQGTNYLMAGIIPKPATRESSTNIFEWINNSNYSSYSTYTTYNYVFFDTSTEQYHSLLESNNFVILQTTGFPQPVYDPANPSKPAPVVEFWLYGIVKADTSQDGFLDYRDQFTVAMSDVGGNGYTELISNVDAILSMYQKSQSEIFVIYSAAEKNFIAKVNPLTREVLSTIEMDLGEDVK